MTIEFTMEQSIGFAVVLLLVGRWLRHHVYFFERFAIPAPVIGGLIFAILNLVFYETGWVEFVFITSLQQFFMIIFFTTVGFGASPRVLKMAGPKVMVFLGLAVSLVVLQNVVAIVLAPVVGISRGLALMTGSTAMTGGHGTSAGIAPLIEQAGFIGAESIAYTAATFGLIMGSLLGGPLANRVIQKRKLHASTDSAAKPFLTLVERARYLDAERMLRAVMVILLAMFAGSYLTNALNALIVNVTSMAQFPAYLGPMLLAILFRAISDVRETNGKDSIPTEEIEVLGHVSLELFLAMALMSMRLWELGSLAFPLIILLTAQVFLALVYTRFVTFRVMGSNYDAAMLTAGHMGFGMGATPNGVANMQSVAAKYGPSPTAFFVLPVVGGMFIDFFNILTIMGFLLFT